MASNEAFKKQAEGASNAAKKFMEENDQLQQKLKEAGLAVPDAGCQKSGGKEEENKNLKQEVTNLKEELDSTKKALQKSDSDVKAMKSQAENLTVEYDRLLGEHSKLLGKPHHQERGQGRCLAVDIGGHVLQVVGPPHRRGQVGPTLEDKTHVNTTPIYN
ncbi:B-cell receptor-associated protein 31 [Merluccius polli]|uniref:Endoplasmic reticulum transmembrane protein n=1 Tax=Merluccius polli TaxID=89951 RepID=A0AA47P0L7_MERPO|nr:B-cell receptor-associated protein 31 [Merluccius polli]